MNDQNQEVFGFIGLGLIGGSIARALRAAFPGCRVIAADPDAMALSLAKHDGVVSETASVGPAFSACRVIFLCAPVSTNAASLEALKPYLSSGTIVTDTGSVKGDTMRCAGNLGLSGCFIGGHPMTGSERTGYRNSKALLLENAWYILTPAEQVPEEDTAYMRSLVSAMGAMPLVLTPSEHDRVTAAVSHLPHIVSAALVNLVRESDSEEGTMKQVAAGGFKDITRISSSSPEMWEQICMTNRGPILSLLDRYIRELTDFRAHLAEGEAEEMNAYFGNARAYRESFSDSASGPIKSSYSVRVDVADQPGVIAELAIILANRQISIKNIGISHNREFEEGVLAIEFHTEKAAEQARFLLISRGYTVY